MFITRLLQDLMIPKLSDSKVLIVIGARQTGKTTLIKHLIEGKTNIRFWNGDDPDIRALLSNAGSSFLKRELAGTAFLVIDEAQRIENIGITLKIIADNIPGVKLLATGSSAFELSNRINEPLTGRKWEFRLYPLSFEEMVNHHGLMEEKRLLPVRLLYGYYPEVVNNAGSEKEVLRALTDSFLYKDILQWENIQKPNKLLVLLQALAYQVGNMVSYNELSKTVGLDKKTVEKYIDLLEKVFVIFRVSSFSRNLRNELSQAQKYYFYDTGIRNALIAAFQPVDNRQDIGGLWENFIIAERVKYLHYHNLWTNNYFWRTQAQQEIDWIEDSDGTLHTFEIKWSPKARAALSKTFSNAYPNHTFSIVHRDNFEEILL